MVGIGFWEMLIFLVILFVGFFGLVGFLVAIYFVVRAAARSKDVDQESRSDKGP
jgi:uncharacterized membrane protein